jgi:hypothetical protein
LEIDTLDCHINDNEPTAICGDDNIDGHNYMAGVVAVSQQTTENPNSKLYLYLGQKPE